MVIPEYLLDLSFCVLLLPGDTRTELDCICLKSAGGGDAELLVVAIAKSLAGCSKQKLNDLQVSGGSGGGAAIEWTGRDGLRWKFSCAIGHTPLLADHVAPTTTKLINHFKVSPMAMF